MDKRLFTESQLTELESIEILGGIDSPNKITFSKCVIQPDCTQGGSCVQSTCTYNGCPHFACAFGTCTNGNCTNANCVPELGCTPIHIGCGLPESACSSSFDTCG